MFLYIDALFVPKDVEKFQLSHQEGWNSLTTDCDDIRNTPPFLLKPTAVMTVTSSGDMKIFDNPDTRCLLEDFGKYLNSSPLTGNESLVGWYLDQTVIPVLCANAVMEDVKLPSRLFRKMDEKWSRTVGYSMERAFWQGWYSSIRKDDDSGDLEITLDKALKFSGMGSIDDILQDISESSSDVSCSCRKLMARISAISRIYSRYHDIVSGGY